jgi:hypothetical protein
MLPIDCPLRARAARAATLLLALCAACSIEAPEYAQALGAGGGAQTGTGALQGGSGGVDPSTGALPAGSSGAGSSAAPQPPGMMAEPPAPSQPRPPSVPEQPALPQASAAASQLSVSAEQVLEGDSVIFQLVVNDASGQPLGRGGDVVAFSVSGGDAQGSFGPVQDLGNGTYSAAFTATRAGSALTAGATIDGVAVDHAALGAPLPSLRVLRYSNRALSFDGSTQFLALGDLLMVTGSFSLWLNTAASDGYLLSKLLAGDTAEGEVRLLLEDGRVVFRIDGALSAEVRSEVVLSDSRWHHVLVGFNPGLALYVDGQLQGVANTSNMSGLLVSGPTLEIGRNNATGEDHYLGLLDELAFFNRPLTAAEALAVYGSGSPGNLQSLSTGSNLLDWWHLGEFDTPPVLQDSVGELPLQMVEMTAANVVTVER